MSSGLDLRQAWKQLDKKNSGLEALITFAKKAASLGEPLLAYDMAKCGLERFPHSTWLIQLAALAQARSGSPLRAVALLEPLLGVEENVEDTYGILARAYKDLWLRSEKEAEKRKFGEKALELYGKGYSKTGGIYSGLNMAFMLLALGSPAEAKFLAQEIIELCKGSLAQQEGDYWTLASLAEAHLLNEEIEAAGLAYRAALQCRDVGIAEIASTRKQALFIARLLGVETNFKGIFKIPSVVIFSGHMLDTPQRDRPRFPEKIVPQVQERLTEELQRLQAGFGYCSAACGADLLFIEAMLDRGAEVHVVLPFDREDFIAESVAPAGPHWVERFHKALDKATSVSFSTEENYLKDEVLFQLCNDMLQGLAAIRAEAVGAEPHLLVVWDGESESGLGGTSSFLQNAGDRFVSVTVINPVDHLGSIKQGASVAHSMPLSREEHLAEKIPRVIKTLLFADVVGFSKLTERQLPIFQVEYMQRVAQLLNQAQGLCSVNTWGDGLYAVFDQLTLGADWALQFKEMVNRVDWSRLGLSEDFNVRISLHIGPVFHMQDPILKNAAYFGSHVSRVARIEPITTPGCVFGTEQVASLLNTQHSSLRSDYVGTISLAKHYGLYPIYQIRRKGDLE